MFPNKKVALFNKPATSQSTAPPQAQRRRAAADVFAEDESDDDLEAINLSKSTSTSELSHLASMPTANQSQTPQESTPNTPVAPTSVTPSLHRSESENGSSLRDHAPVSSTTTSLPTVTSHLPTTTFNKPIAINIKIKPTQAQPQPFLHDNSLVSLTPVQESAHNTDGDSDQDEIGGFVEIDEEDDPRREQIKEMKKQRREMYRQMAKNKRENQQSTFTTTTTTTTTTMSTAKHTNNHSKSINEQDDFPQGDNVWCFYVSNLGKEVTNAMLEKVFKDKYPTSFLKAKIGMEYDGKTSRGFAFVAFNDPLEMAKAFSAMDGQFCGERRMFIKKADAQDFRTNHDNKRVQYQHQFSKKGSKRH